MRCTMKFGSSICNGTSIWRGPSSLLDIMFPIMSDSFATPAYPRPMTILTSDAIHHQGSPFPLAPFQSILNQLVQSYLEAVAVLSGMYEKVPLQPRSCMDKQLLSVFEMYILIHTLLSVAGWLIWDFTPLFCVYVMTCWDLKIDAGLPSLC